MKKFSLALLAMATALAITPAALATQINGSIEISGNDQSWSSTGITFTNLIATAGDATGNFATVIGGGFPLTVPATINVTNFSFAAPDVLIFTVDGGTATFTITDGITIPTNSNNFLNITGYGNLTLNGYDLTPGTFTFTGTDSSNNSGTTGSSVYGFDITAAPTPEPSSLLLLGTGLLGLAFVAFRKAKPARPVLHLNM